MARAYHVYGICMTCAWHVHDYLRKQSCSLSVRSAVTACSRLARACRRLPAPRLQSCSDARCCRVNSRVMATSMTWTWLPRWMGGRACGWPPHTASTIHYVYVTTYYITTYYLLPTTYSTYMNCLRLEAMMPRHDSNACEASRWNCRSLRVWASPHAARNASQHLVHPRAPSTLGGRQAYYPL